MLRGRTWSHKSDDRTTAISHDEGEKGRHGFGTSRHLLAVLRRIPRSQMMLHISLFVVICFFFVLVAYMPVTSTVKEYLIPVQPHSDCALLFFGLPKQFTEQVLPTVQEHIIKHNPKCDIFAHSFKVSQMSNPRNNETAVIINPESLFAMTDMVVMDTMDEFHAQHNLTFYRQLWGIHNEPWIYPQSMDNMIKQWHSIEKVWDFMEAYSRNNSKSYSQVGLFRSDVLYLDNIHLFDSKAAIPKFASYPANDRMFYGTYTNAKFWARTRFSNIPQAYEDGFFDKGLHSEFYMEEVLLPQMENPVEKKDICFLRVRATGDVLTKDCGGDRGRWFRRMRDSLKEWKRTCLLCDYYF
jgi:hypothetical protein